MLVDRRQILLATAFLLAAPQPGCAAKPGGLKPGPSPMALRADPIDRFGLVSASQQFGRLDFIGGLELSAVKGRFGGISALHLDPDGVGFVMVSDAGFWVTGRFVQTGGRLTGVADTRVAPMLGPDGRSLRSRRRGDTESLAFTADGRAFVGIERVNEIVSFDFRQKGVMARARPVDVPPEVRALPHNRGLEGLAVAPAASPMAGALVGLSERSSKDGPTTAGFLIGGPQPGIFALTRTGEYDVTDLAFLPDGDMVVLERRYSLLTGVGMRLRRIDGAALRPGAVLDGETLLDGGYGYQVDNMEALAVSRGRDGRIEFTVMSDDNFSFFQRTLVLRFALNDLG